MTYTNRWDGWSQILMPEMGLYDQLLFLVSSSRISAFVAYSKQKIHRRRANIIG